MSENHRPMPPDEEDVVFLDEGSADDVARALAEAEAAVSAVREKHRHAAAPPPGAEAAAEPAPPSEGPSDEALRRAEAVAVLLRAEADALRGEVDAARERAAASDEEAAKLRETLVRKVADFENLKRRTEREKADYFKFALTEVFRDLLAVLDNLERAIAHAPAEGSQEFRAGVEMIARQLAETLRRYGLAEVPALGRPFDPTYHEAVQLEASADVPPGSVLEVFQKGYLLNERLLRPALVKVSAAPPPAPPASSPAD